MNSLVNSAKDDVWRALLFYTIYRVFLALIALGFFYFKDQLPGDAITHPGLYLSVALGYLTLSLAGLVLWKGRWFGSDIQSVQVIIADLFILSLFIYATGGLNHSAAEILLFVPVAASGVLLAGRMAVFSASVAIFLVLIQTAWVVVKEGYDNSLFVRSGLLGIGLLATAVLVSRLAARAKKSEQLVRVHAASIEDLGNINELIIQTMDSGVLVIDSGQDLLFINNRARELLGMGHTEVYGQPLSAISVKLTRELKKWKLGEALDDSFGNSKTQTVIQPSFSPLSKDRDLGTLIFVEEIGEARRRAQQAKLAALGRLTGSIAHEIRNPLSAISQAAQILPTSDDKKQRQRLIDMIERNSLRINRIIEDVMSLNKSDGMERDRLDLSRWLPRFLKRYCEDNGLDDAAVEVTGRQLTVLFDRQHLEQVLRNLLDNGFQYGDSSKLPTLSIFIRQADETTVFIDVHDNGPGVEQSLSETIFEPFFTQRPDGSGLGLYISRELCITNGGSLEYIKDDNDTRGFFRITMARVNV